MLGIVGFENLRIRCIIGVNPHERREEQEILLDLKLETDFARVATTDDISNAICYATVADFCTELAQKGRYQMLETFAYELIQQLTSRFKLSWIKVVVKKPLALPKASFAFVELEQGKAKR